VSISEEGLRSELEIHAPVGAYDIEVYDGNGRLRWRGDRPVRLELPRGIYQVRTLVGDSVANRFVRHEGRTDVYTEPPAYRTPALIAGASTSHEYYTRQATNWSTRCTGANEEGPPDLFIFVRALDLNAAGRGWLRRAELLLRTPSGGKIPIWPRGAVAMGPDGWLAFSHRMPAGAYELVAGGPSSRAMSVHVLEGWCTQVFLLAHARLQLEGASVFLARKGEPFSPDSPTVRAVDLGLHALQHEGVIPRQEMELLLTSKFDNPMLGLVGAHLLINQRRTELTRAVLAQLRRLIPGSPDLLALDLRSARRESHTVPFPPFSVPPMLRVGMATILKWALPKKGMMTEGLAELASNSLQDSPWTQWLVADAPAPVDLSPPGENPRNEPGPTVGGFDVDEAGDFEAAADQVCLVEAMEAGDFEAAADQVCLVEAMEEGDDEPLQVGPPRENPRGITSGSEPRLEATSVARTDLRFQPDRSHAGTPVSGGIEFSRQPGRLTPGSDEMARIGSGGPRLGGLEVAVLQWLASGGTDSAFELLARPLGVTHDRLAEARQRVDGQRDRLRLSYGALLDRVLSEH